MERTCSLSSTSQCHINLNLHPKQATALTTPATEILYGGAAGGGKSHLFRVASIIWCTEVPGLQVYLFRRSFPDLEKNHMTGPKGYRALLAPWVNHKWVTITEKEIRFWNGSKIYLAHCNDEKDRFNYQGAEMHVLMVDELTHFTEIIYRFLRSRVRLVGLKVPEKYKGFFPRILNGSNPGNVGHLWVKGAFVDPAPPMDIRRTSDEEGGLLRQFIPARLEDNPSMLQDDPTYRIRLRGLGSEALVKAMEHGDWNIVEGAYFDGWDPRRHVIEPFRVPDWWVRLRGFDWGSARPFSYGEYAVSDGSRLADGRSYPTGALIRTYEWYGCKRTKEGVAVANTGLKMTAQAIARQIQDTRGHLKFQRSVADPSIFKQDGGISIAEAMEKEGVIWDRADNARVARLGALGGWNQIRDRLAGDDHGPMLYIFKNCTELIRTLPALQHDQLNPEDLDTDGEDHAADELRYACMARPWHRAKVEQEPMKTMQEMTFDEILANQPKNGKEWRV